MILGGQKCDARLRVGFTRTPMELWLGHPRREIVRRETENRPGSYSP